MAETRNSMRINSSEKCELDLDGSVYQCRLANISSSGAMVKCLGFLREFWPGDKGVLRCHDLDENIPCRITHIAAAKIGLQFANQGKIPAAKRAAGLSAANLQARRPHPGSRGKKG